MNRTEVITRGNCPVTAELAPGVELRLLVSGQSGARGLCTGTATFRPGAVLPYHRHPCSEAITVLSGRAAVFVEGRRYRVKPFDALHVPAGSAHQTCNDSPDDPALLLSSFASDTPTRELVEERFPVVEVTGAEAAGPEHRVAFEAAPVYELAPRAFFRDLFARRFGSRGFCGGFGLFEPRAALPCHVHAFDKSITIVAGRAVCQVAGREYELSGCDTVCVPAGRPYRLTNQSSAPMAVVWVYAGDEPDRTPVDQGYCEGLIPLDALGGL
jgi:quercetin dioxygenase-like cupin family protein